MPKKRIVKKRIQKRKKTTTTQDKKPDVSQMSKLEYEQSMMDPRFRAAMIGFGNTNTQLPILAQRFDEISKKVNDNNSIHRELNNQQELNNLIKENTTLKQQKKQNELEFKSKMDEIKFQSEIALLKKEAEAKAKSDLHQMKIIELQNETNAAKYKLEQQKRQHQDQELLAKLTSEQTLTQMEAKLTPRIQQLQDDTSELKRGLEQQQAQHDFEKEERQAMHEQAITAIQKATQDAIQPLKDETTQVKNQLEVSQANFNKVQEVLKLQHEKQMAQIKSSFQTNTHELQTALTALKQENEKKAAEFNLNQQKGDLEFQLDKAQMDLLKQSIIQPLQEQLSQLKREYETNNDQHQITQQMQEIRNQIEIIKTHTDPQKLQEHYGNILDKQKELHKVRTALEYATEIHDIERETAKGKADIVKNMATVDPTFDPALMDNPDFNKHLLDKLKEVQNQRIKLQQQQALAEQSAKIAQQRDELTTKVMESEALTQALENPPEELQQKKQELATKTGQLQAEKEQVSNIMGTFTETLDDLDQTHVRALKDIAKYQATFPGLDRFVQQSSGHEFPTLQDYSDFTDKFVRFYQSNAYNEGPGHLLLQMKRVVPDDDDSPEVAQRKRQALDHFRDFYSPYVNRNLAELQETVQNLGETNEQLLQQMNDQSRKKQKARLLATTLLHHFGVSEQEQLNGLIQQKISENQLSAEDAQEGYNAIFGEAPTSADTSEISENAEPEFHFPAVTPEPITFNAS